MHHGPVPVLTRNKGYILKPYRTLLFVSAANEAMVLTGAASGADGLILCLEDLCPQRERPRARLLLPALMRRLAAENPGLGLFVRVNPLDTIDLSFDLEAVVRPELDGLVTSKIDGPEDIMRLDALTTEWERRNGVTAGQIKYVVVPETAECMERCYEVAKSARVANVAGTISRGDVAHALGFEWTPEGTETLYLRSRVLMASRAAGIRHPLCALWFMKDDLQGLEAYVRREKQLGYRGAIILQPYHAAIVNQVFTPTQAELDSCNTIIREFEAALAAGESEVLFEGRMLHGGAYQQALEIVQLAQDIASLRSAGADKP